MKIAIIGESGQLGSEIKNFLSKSFPLTCIDRNKIELTSSYYFQYLHSIDFDVLINTSAIHNIKYAEENPQLTFNLNSNTPFELAMICKKKNKIFIHFSTDYVFDGKKNTPYNETDNCNPLSVYGRSKHEGEQKILSISGKNYIFRVSGLFGSTPPRGKEFNFVDAIIDQTKRNQIIKVVDDQIMNATSTFSIAEMLKHILIFKVPYGLYHYTNVGNLSWYNFAKLILKISKINYDIESISLNDLQIKQLRPKYSCLSCVKISKYVRLKLIEDTLQEYILLKYGS